MTTKITYKMVVYWPRSTGGFHYEGYEFKTPQERKAFFQEYKLTSIPNLPPQARESLQIHFVNVPHMIWRVDNNGS